MTENPYAAPQAQVLDPVASSGEPGFSVDPITCRAGYGMKWLVDGWNYFLQSPWVWIGMALVWMLIVIALSVVPFIGGLASNMLNWVLIAGMMIGCDKLRRGRELTIGDLFEGFKANFQQLIIVGALYLGGYFLIIMVCVVIFMIAGGAALFAAGPNMLQDSWLQENWQSIGLVVALVLLVAVGLTIPLIMLVWFAPALVAIEGMEALAACKASFVGCLRNWLPYLIWGLLLFGILLLIYVPIGILIAIKGGAVLSFSIMILVMSFMALISMPITMSSTYAAYRDIYYRA